MAPILLCGAETWGFNNMDVVENVHTRFCKITKSVNIVIVALFMKNLSDPLLILQPQLEYRYLIIGTKWLMAKKTEFAS